MIFEIFCGKQFSKISGKTPKKSGRKKFLSSSRIHSPNSNGNAIFDCTHTDYAPAQLRHDTGSNTAVVMCATTSGVFKRVEIRTPRYRGTIRPYKHNYYGMVQCHNKTCSGRCQGVSDPSCENLTVSIVTNCHNKTTIYSNPGSQDVVVF